METSEKSCEAAFCSSYPASSITSYNLSSTMEKLSSEQFKTILKLDTAL